MREEKASGEKELERELEALYRKVAGPDQEEDDPGPAPPPKPEAEEPGKPKAREQNERHEKGKKTGPASLFSRGLARTVLVLLVIGLAGVFFWPTIYHYGALNLGGEVYPLRVNRLTGEAAYFDGVKWMQPPLLMSYKEPVPGNPKDQESTSVPSAAKDEKTRRAGFQADSAPAKPRIQGKYAIQIRAFPEREKDSALSFAADIKKRLSNIDVETVHVPGRGVWHRILFGNFESIGDASDSLKKSNLLHTYPDSFVQKKSTK